MTDRCDSCAESETGFGGEACKRCPEFYRITRELASPDGLIPGCAHYNVCAAVRDGTLNPCINCEEYR